MASSLGEKQSVMIAPGKLAFYQLVLNQLREDGLEAEGNALASRLNIESDKQSLMKSKDQLYEMYESYVSQAAAPAEQAARKNWVAMRCRPHPPIAPQEDLLDLRQVEEPEMDTTEDTGGMDVADYMQEIHGKPIPSVRLRFTSQHKQGTRGVAFSHDGRLCASASVDTSIKVMETAKLRMHSVVQTDTAIRPVASAAPVDDLRPIIRTFYDHVAAVTSVAFHPKLPVLYSGSVDKTVKVYDLTRPSQNKKAQASVTDVSPINVVSSHPCGDFLFVGTQHKVVRLYDTTTMQCYSSYHHASQHAGAVSDIKSAADGSMFSSVGADGCIFLWDGINHRVVNRIPHAHNGQAIFTCQWSRNQRYLLTAGGDNKARLWDLRNGKQLQIYSAASTASSCEFMSATFAGQEQYLLLASSEISDGGDLAVLDAHSGNVLVKRLNMHERAVRAIAPNPIDKTFLTASDDARVRFFDIDTSGAHEPEVMAPFEMPSSGFVQHVGL